MKIAKKFGQSKPTKRLDLSAMRDALKDSRCWSCLGLVVSENGGPHYELDGEDVLIEVELQPSGERVTARLGAVAGGSGRGVWSIPALGTEVVLLVPDGDLGFMPCIVATLSTGNVSVDLDDTVLLIDNSLGDIAIVPNNDVSLGVKGATEQAVRGNSFQSRFNDLVTQFNALVTYINSHTHSGVTAGDGTSGHVSSPSSQSGVSSTAGDLSPNVKVA